MLLRRISPRVCRSRWRTRDDGLYGHWSQRSPALLHGIHRKEAKAGVHEQCHGVLLPFVVLLCPSSFPAISFDAVLDKICEIVDTGPSDASAPPPYLIFDFPGQIELFTHNDCVHNILRRICDPPADGSSSRPRPRRSGTRLCAVNLVDATFCTDSPKFIEAVSISYNSFIFRRDTSRTSVRPRPFQNRPAPPGNGRERRHGLCT